ncbi:WecB/TagA/CpsF family glycosyltransferase [Marivirga arenosa]|uniref:WecB/TagA/CpsF family glycosyltransferase n=1 Tax=Marivirga arenosa TaxID=3059076 RepID=A0AA49JI54_9BACT|nr:WecB/TagA/CpsF family glycosyltransferase [Marivirga sp. ABR2-2]WKK86021.2 WecB/TagA/CpsF family glycosyltransferase [Marivirga sp. ABR2-2]
MIKVEIINEYKIHAPQTRNELLEYIGNYKGILVAMNAEKILKKDNRLKNLINNNLGYPDGIGAVWALKKKGLQTTKIAGAEFWLDIINKFHRKKSFYLVGASVEVIKQTVNKLQFEFPEIDIRGHRNGFIQTDEEKNDLIQDISKKKPDVVFVAMGTPKQEFLMEEMLSHNKSLYMGLGGSFDVYSGHKNRAPDFFINNWLEWLYRLLKEPTRYKRQLVLIKFFFLVMFNRI